MSVEKDLNEVQKSFQNSEREALEILKDKRLTKEKVEKAFIKANSNKSSLQEVWDYLMSFFSIIKDYINGSYKEISFGSVAAILAALIYFLSPIDFIPDFIPGIGFIDDVFVIGLVIKQVKEELDRYNHWKKIN